MASVVTLSSSSEATKLTLSGASKPHQQDKVLRQPLQCRNLVMDMGDVFCFWSKGTQATPISAFDLKKIIACPSWHDYEMGKLEKHECFKLVNQEFGLNEGDLEQTIKTFARDMQWNHELVEEVQKIKAMSHGELRFFLMTNISQPDFEDFRPIVESWNIFDKIFTSAEAGARKPELAFYNYVLRNAGISAESAVFTDDKPENVILAQSMGMHGVLFESTTQVIHDLNVLLRDPVQRAQEWTAANARNMWSVTENNIVIHDQFAQLVMLEMSVDRTFLTIREGQRHWNTFLEKPIMTDADFPDDFDTTSMALLNLDIPNDLKHSVMDEMLTYPRSDGLFGTYFEPKRPRFCICVSANILRLFYANNRGHQVKETLDRLIEVLESGAYRFGTRYYADPEWFLFLLADLWAKNSAAPELERLRSLLVTHIRARIGTSLNDLAIGCRVLAAQHLGIEDDAAPDLSLLLKRQVPDGSWSQRPWIWKYGRSGMQAGNVGMVTAMARTAVERAGADRIKQALRIWW